jgi:hypothetical protein
MNNIDKARYFIKKAAVHNYLRSMLRNIKLEKIAQQIQKTQPPQVPNKSTPIRRGKQGDTERKVFSKKPPIRRGNQGSTRKIPRNNTSIVRGDQGGTNW